MADITDVSTGFTNLSYIQSPASTPQTLREILEVCDDYDIAMVEVNGIKVVFNPALGPEPEIGAPISDDSPDPDESEYSKLMNGSLPKFNNEK